jgi:hypothetical protein
MRDVTREFSVEMKAINERILQEVACAGDWSDISGILHRYRQHYFALPPRVREHLNEAIKDLMQERISE